MNSNDVLLCLSLDEQRQDEVYNRLVKRGCLPRISSVRQLLTQLTLAELVRTRTTEGGERFYRLAEGEAVETALNEAWAKAEKEQGRNEKPQS